MSVTASGGYGPVSISASATRVDYYQLVPPERQAEVCRARVSQAPRPREREGDEGHAHRGHD
jgi:hypothetical protein